VRSLNAKIEFAILEEFSRVMALLLGVYGVFRALDLARNGALPYLFARRVETLYFWIEIILLVVLPLALLSQSKVRHNPQFLYWTCAIVVMGFMANRLNVSITAIDAMTGANYVPKWPEFALTIVVLTAGVCAFRWAIIYLDIVPKRELPPQVKWVAAAAEA
jgi:Ni/Fe-hydrogenase subunit HybB-like protein